MPATLITLLPSVSPPLEFSLYFYLLLVMVITGCACVFLIAMRLELLEAKAPHLVLPFSKIGV